MRRFLQLATLALASLALSLLLAEGCLRLLGYRGITYLRIDNTQIVEDPILNWRYTPNNAYYFNNVEYRINEAGFRDRTYPNEKPPNTFRIFLASDSIGYGVNVRLEDSYPKVLESLLNRLPDPRHFEVVSHSMPGLSLNQKLHLVKLYARKYDPDALIVDYCMNDMAPDFMWRQPNPQTHCTISQLHIPIPCSLERGLKHSAFAVALRQVMESYLLRAGRELENTNYQNVRGDHFQQMYAGEAPLRLDETLRGIQEFRDQFDTPVLVPIFPILYQMKDYRWSNLARMVESGCQRHGLNSIDLLPTLATFSDQDARVQRGDFFHPSVKGHRAVAAAILKALIDRSILVQPPAD